jgi:hypothetical protein
MSNQTLVVARRTFLTFQTSKSTHFSYSRLDAPTNKPLDWHRLNKMCKLSNLFVGYPTLANTPHK